MPLDPFKKPEFAPKGMGKPGLPSKYELPKLKKKTETKKQAPQKKAAPNLSRGEFRRELRKMPYDITIKMLGPEREKQEKDFSYSKYGSEISFKERGDVDNRIRILNREKSKAKTYQDRLDIQHKINLLIKLKKKEAEQK